MGQTRHRYQYRSLFWPVLLIGLGIILLLENLNLIPAVNLTVLFRLWPLLLIVIGLDLLVGHRSPFLGALIGLILALAVAVLVVMAPALGLTATPTVNSSSFREPLAGATSARIDLDLSVGTSTIQALSDSPDLIQADLTHVGEVQFTAQGETEKVITLRQVNTAINFDLFDIANTFKDLRWEIGLSPNIPLALDISGGVGNANINLSSLQLTDLNLNGGVGAVSLTLPATEQPYFAQIAGDVGSVKVNIEDGATLNANIDGGLGAFNLTIGDDADVSLQIKGDVGNFIIDLPNNTAARLGANVDVGKVSVPARFNLISGGDRQGPSQQGVWQTPNFEQADRRIIIEFKGDVGGLTLR